MSLSSLRKVGGTVIGSILMVLGFIDIPNQIKEWSLFVSSHGELIRTFLVLAGLGIVLSIHVLPHLRPTLNIELTPSSGPSGDLVLSVTNRGTDRTLFAKGRPLDMRNSPNEMTNRNFDLEWEGKKARQVRIHKDSTENLVVAGWTISPDHSLGEMWLIQFSDSPAKLNSCRWNMISPYGEDTPPELDVEITIFGIGCRTPKKYEFTVKLAAKYGPLTMVPIRQFLT